MLRFNRISHESSADISLANATIQTQAECEHPFPMRKRIAVFRFKSICRSAANRCLSRSLLLSFLLFFLALFLTQNKRHKMDVYTINIYVEIYIDGTALLHLRNEQKREEFPLSETGFGFGFPGQPFRAVEHPI